MKQLKILIPLRVQLVVTYLCLFTIIFSASFYYVSSKVESELTQRSTEGLVQQGQLIANLFTHSMIRHMLTEGQRQLIVLEMKRSSLRTGSWLGIVNQKGYILENTGRLRNHWVGDRPEVRSALRGEISSTVRRHEPPSGPSTAPAQGGGTPSSALPESKGSILYVAVPIRLYDIVQGAMYLSKPLESNEAFLASLTQHLVQAGGGAFFLTTVLIYLFATLLTRSLGKITKGVRQMEEGKLREAITGLPSNEIGLLGSAFNHMAEALRTQMEKLSFVLSRMADGVLVLGEDGRIEYINEAARRYLQPDSSDRAPASNQDRLSPPPSPDLSVPSLDPRISTFFGSLLRGVGPPVTEVEFPERGSIKILATPILKQEKPSGLIAVFHDVTEYRRLEKLRAQFVSDVSHELKTPLSAIKSLCDALTEGALEDPAQGKKFLSSMEKEVDRLSRLVKDLLDLSKLESGAFPLRKEEVVLEEVIRETLEKFPHATALARLPDGKTVVGADPDRIRQVFYNLFDNTIRCLSGVADPKMEVSIQRWQEKVMVSVRDNGPGISSEDLHRIFERFYRVDPSRTRRDGGTGLGLAIVKQIIEAHGGEIWAESSAGEGSTFSFTLPAAQAAEGAQS